MFGQSFSATAANKYTCLEIKNSAMLAHHL
jgi:hypothetical protein